MWAGVPGGKIQGVRGGEGGVELTRTAPPPLPQTLSPQKRYLLKQSLGGNGKVFHKVPPGAPWPAEGRPSAKNENAAKSIGILGRNHAAPKAPRGKMDFGPLKSEEFLAQTLWNKGGVQKSGNCVP